jgi:glycosyltransferase involved in cell wall biosynthesis
VLLRTALASALAQPNVVQVVVVDDASSDATSAELALLQDSRVTVVRNDEPAGVAAARNLGLSQVTAPWVAFLDDDDAWGPGHVAGMLDAWRRSGVGPDRIGIVYSGYLVTTPDRRVVSVREAGGQDWLPHGLEEENVIGTPSCALLWREAVVEAGGFDERLAIVADWDLWVRVLAERRAVHCPEYLVGYMHHGGNMHFDGDRLVRELVALQRKHGWKPRPGSVGPRGERVPLYIASAYRAGGRRFRAAWWYLRSFRVRGHGRDLARAAGMMLGERMIERSGLKRPPPVDPSLGGWLLELAEAERASGSDLPALSAAWRAGVPAG